MDAGQKMHDNKRAYGNILQTIRRADSLERAIKGGYSREDIVKVTASYKQAAAKSGPVILHGLTSLGSYDITQGRRV